MLNVIKLFFFLDLYMEFLIFFQLIYSFIFPNSFLAGIKHSAIFFAIW